ncbi:HTH-type transcriptional regulator BetI [Austwickia sp. TVS 96-490-7B]|uniref:TetR/AcrR family transcriptional regulator n=1 Tax=Austwickia sp. TVS 96-490-7B TaxID=2830843 RepID=UPI001C57A440|nr:TetR/AcrR family transcriptional regulator [Austwickia sp. TVS 96-490-7B]MBW3086795.1 HTH-type transcriptional regulator BetI [Austwickia sp. TVS 96-490-7B]
MTPRHEGAGPPIRRRLDVAQRRASIVAAAAEIYATTPYSQVPTEEIARQAGASPALVFHYFGSKADLYAAVIHDDLSRLRDAKRAAAAALPTGSPVRDRVKARLEAHLDHAAAHRRTPTSPASEPAQATHVRAHARAENVDDLSSLLGIHQWTRHTYAVLGYLGFVDYATSQWIDQDCSPDQRHPLIDAALGALEGALGDWAVSPLPTHSNGPCHLTR